MLNAFDFWDMLDASQKRNLKKVERKYGSNRWWESDDPLVVIRHQIEEPFQVISFPEYKDMLGLFLERPVAETDFMVNFKGLQNEVRIAIKRKEGNGIQNEEQREAGYHTYRRNLEKYVSKMPKNRIVKID